MKDAGLTVTAAANITAMFQTGGTVGAVQVGWVMDKVHPAR
jgi:AAHS family 4-hydroxybenzoate transporter-like MFS transporter